MEKIKHIAGQFQGISLEDSSEVKLMDRFDCKYWFPLDKLDGLMSQLIDDYFILEINGERLMEYRNDYFDTTDDLFYLKHHNKRVNRHKVRYRQYQVNRRSFLEVKLKNNKKRVKKERIESDISTNGFYKKETEFLDEKLPLPSNSLEKKLHVRYTRMTLINKQMKDRCTIDIVPEFRNEKGTKAYPGLVIFELKRSRSMKLSPLYKVLREMQIRQEGLSKYCTGRALLDENLKQNRFKRKLLFLKRELTN
ncbi:VTC domain-containing protein [Maribellus sediminis]|uniref:VTC domain-containing protein n=1 Tax=Maribellus sediminis TaxID=2696285 RepID=UPI00142FB517|nr:VTC domain-containing protein [Maribellus sediminis]